MSITLEFVRELPFFLVGSGLVTSSTSAEICCMLIFMPPLFSCSFFATILVGDCTTKLFVPEDMIEVLPALLALSL